MADFLTIIITIFIIIVAVISVMLSNIDRKRMHVYVIAKAMKEHLDVFVRFIDKRVTGQYAEHASITQLRSLTDQFSGLKKGKDALKMIPLINSIVALYKTFDTSDSLPESEGAMDRLDDAMENISLLRAEYNLSVKNLNKQLSSRVFTGLVKLFRMKKLEELCEFPSFSDYIERRLHGNERI